MKRIDKNRSMLANKIFLVFRTLAERNRFVVDWKGEISLTFPVKPTKGNAKYFNDFHYLQPLDFYLESEEETMTHEADRICEEIVSGEYMQYQQVEDRIKNVVETVCCGFDEILNFSELCEAVDETTNFEEWFIREILKNRKMKAETFFPVWMHDELKQKYSEFLFEWIYERFGFSRFGVSYNKNYHDKKPKIEDCNVSIYEY